MARPAKVKPLTDVEKKYVELSLKSHNNVNYDELFQRLANELGKAEDVIRAFADKVDVLVEDTQLPPEPKAKELKPEQKMVRDLLTPNRHSESNKARHVTVMSESASENIEKMPSGPIKGSSRNKDCIFRQ